MKDTNYISCLIVIISLILLPLQILIYGLVIRDVWNWFMPMLFDVEPIVYSQSIALTFMVSLFGSSNSIHKHEEDELKRFSQVFTSAIIQPLFLWLTAWIAYLFIS